MKKLFVKNEETEWLFAPDWEYYDYGDCKRHLELIFPYRREWTSDERFPVVLFIPGAAWHKQELYNSIPQYARLAELGFVVAVLECRELEIAKFPAQIEDVAHAVAHLETIAEQFHMDMNRLFLAGNSSGGHIAMMAALFRAHGLCKPFREPKGIFLESASTDILTCAKDPLPPWMTTRPSAGLLGVDSIEGNEELARKASCSMYIEETINLPPVLLLHGDADTVVSVENSRILYDKLNAAKKKVVYYELAGIDHGGAPFWEKEVLDVIKMFLLENS